MSKLDSIMKYKIGQPLFLRQKIMQERASRLGDNTQIWDIGDCVIPIIRMATEESEDSTVNQYICRNTRHIADSELVRYHEHELMDEEEALELLRFKESLRKKPEVPTNGENSAP